MLPPDIEYDIELSAFRHKCILAKITNKQACIKAGIKFNPYECFVMTPQEENEAKFFNHQAIYIKDMDLLTMRAHLEELEMWAAEVKPRIRATRDRINQLQKQNGDIKPTGFARSINEDSTSTDALNSIKKRAASMTKMEKVAKIMREQGIDESFIQQALSARNIKANEDSKRVQNVDPAEKATNQPLVGVGLGENQVSLGSHGLGGVSQDATKQESEAIAKQSEEPFKFNFVNPFEKK